MRVNWVFARNSSGFLLHGLMSGTRFFLFFPTIFFHIRSFFNMESAKGVVEFWKKIHQIWKNLRGKSSKNLVSIWGR